MAEEIDGGKLPGARGEPIGFSTSDLGELERLDYTEALAPEEEPGYWRKVLIHSLAIRADIYRELGGFPVEYGDFGPWILAIALRESGQELTYTPRPAVRHAYTGELDVLAQHVCDFAHGEMLYCATAPEAAQQVPGRGRGLDEPLVLTRAGAWQALRTGLVERRRSWGLLRHA